MTHQYSHTLKKIRLIVFSILVLIATTFKIKAQGWSFNAELKVTGNCYGVQGVTLPTATGFRTQAQCEAVRQYVLSIAYYTGTCNVYYVCTSCTGFDIVDQNLINPGNVSTDNKVEGKPFFTPHSNKAMEDYGENYKQSKKSLKIDRKSSTYGIHRVPNTGNWKFDEKYFKNSLTKLKFTNPKGKASHGTEQGGQIQKGYEVGDPSVVDLTGKEGKVYPNDLTSSKQQAEADQWSKEHSITYNPIATNEGLRNTDENPLMGYDEAALRVWLDNQDGLKGIIAAFAVNVLDGDNDLLNKAIEVIRYGSIEEQNEIANKAFGGSVAINAAKKTAYDKTIGAMTDMAKSILGLNKLLKTVNGAEEVHDVFQFGIDVNDKRTGND